MTLSPQISTSSSCVFIVSASRASAEPSPSAPTSPMMIRAGAALNHRNPMHAPANAAASTARSSGLTTAP